MNNDWRKLRVGDRIRFIHVPNDFATADGYLLHRDTLRLYRRLIARRRSVRVAYLSEWGDSKAPWIRCQFRRKDGRIEYHSLAVTESDGWVKVRPRKSNT